MLNVTVRSLHLIFVFLLGAALQAPLVSGAAMLLLDLRTEPLLFREVSGASLIIKFAALSWMAADDYIRQPMFWGALVWSVGIFLTQRRSSGTIPGGDPTLTGHLFHPWTGHSVRQFDVSREMRLIGFGPHAE